MRTISKIRRISRLAWERGSPQSQRESLRRKEVFFVKGAYIEPQMPVAEARLTP